MDETIETIGQRLKAKGYQLRSGQSKDLYYIVDPTSGTYYSFRKVDDPKQKSADGPQWTCLQITMNHGAASAAQVLAIALGTEQQVTQEKPDQPKQETPDV